MAETLTINVPQVIRIANTSAHVKRFAAYKENFTTTLEAGKAIEFQADTAGQVFYYLKQATEGLEVTQLQAFSDSPANTVQIKTPATITLSNAGTTVKEFIPYKENFQVSVAAGDSVVLPAKTVGQVLYYLAQKVDKFTVAQAPASTSTQE